jgi:hypothetical protein
MARLLVALLFACAAGMVVGQAPEFRDRQKFVEAIKKVRVGMPEAAVIELLGKPEDIRTKR